MVNWHSPATLARAKGVTLSAVYQNLWAGRYPGARRLKKGGRFCWQIPLDANEPALSATTGNAATDNPRGSDRVRGARKVRGTE